MRHSALLLSAILATSPLSRSHAAEAAEIVVAIRYLQPRGVSHSHLYLYREDGKLLRQLTKDDSGQDFDPLFAPDGRAVVFRREKEGGVVEFWNIRPKGGRATRLEAAPEWYSTTRTSPFFTNFEPEPEEPAASPTPESSATPDRAEEDPPRTHHAPDGSVEIVVQRLAGDEDDGVNGEGTGKHFLLRDLKAGSEVEMGTLPGFLGLWDVLHLKGQPGQVYLLQGALRVAFFQLHLNSTDGDTVFALDLNRSELVRLSPNWAVPIPLQGEAAFFTFTFNRYVPIPGSTKTANCTYLERWTSELKNVRYARPGTAAICYGASMYRPGRTPTTVNFRRDAE